MGRTRRTAGGCRTMPTTPTARTARLLAPMEVFTTLACTLLSTAHRESFMIALGSTPTSPGQRRSPELTPPQSPMMTGVVASKLRERERNMNVGTSEKLINSTDRNHYVKY